MNHAIFGFRSAASAAAALLIAVGLSACACPNAAKDCQDQEARENAADQPCTVQLKFPDRPQTTPPETVKRGDEFVVILKSYPKQGKVWTWDDLETAKFPVKLISWRFRRADMPANDPRYYKPMLEAGDECEQEFIFKRTGRSAAALHFTRSHSENDKDADRKYTYQLPKGGIF